MVSSNDECEWKQSMFVGESCSDPRVLDLYSIAANSILKLRTILSEIMPEPGDMAPRR